MYHALKEQFQYRITRLFARGIAVQYVAISLAAIFTIIVGMSSFYLGLFHNDVSNIEGIAKDIDGGFWDTLWWSTKHVLDPGQFGEDYGAPWPVLIVSFILSVAGLALFGMMIGITSSVFQRRFEGWKLGNTSVMEQDHMLVLGWNQNAVGILRYFAAIGYKNTVVILAPVAIQEMQDVIRTSADVHDRLDIVLRSGVTSEAEELTRVAAEQASCVISVAHDAGNSGHPDVASIKTLMLLSKHPWKRERPRMVAEVKEKRNADIADIAGGRQIPIVSSAEVISRVMVQYARYPGLSDFYRQLISPLENNVVAKSFPELDDKIFGEVAQQFPDSIPLGVTWTTKSNEGQRTACALNVEPDYDLSEDEQLILLSRHDDPERDKTMPTQAFVENEMPRSSKTKLNRIAIVGWNGIIDEMLQEFDGHALHGAEVIVLASIGDEQAADTIDQIKSSLNNIKVEFQRGETVNRETLQRLDPWSYDRLVLLADESHTTEDADSRTIMSSLLLSDMQRASGKTLPHTVIELHDVHNRALLTDVLHSDIIVSPELVSMQLAQISQQQVLGAIYRELLSAGGMEIALRPASEYAEVGSKTSFGDLLLAAQGYTEIALGVRTAAGFSINPPKSRTDLIREEDQIVVLAQQIYD